MPSFQNPDYSFFGSETQGLPPQVVAPATGTTVVMDNRYPRLYVNTATLAALTILLPSKPYPGMEVNLAFKSTITALTVHDGFGNAITGTPSNSGNAAAIIVYVNQAIGWVVWK